MKKFTAIILSFALLAAACGDDEATCEDVADSTIDLLQEVSDFFGGLDEAAVGAVFAGGPLPEEVGGLLETSGVLAAQAQELECANFADLLAERGDQLEVASENIIGGFIKAGVISGDEDVLSRLAP